MKKDKHSYVGHSKVYYRGSNPYSLYWCESGSFYSIYFDYMPTIHVYKGRDGLGFNGGEIDSRLMPEYRKEFIDLLASDLMEKFCLDVEYIL